LRERGYAPRKVGHDAWESRCPAHRSSDHALSITRNEFNQVVLECRSTENCQHIRIVRAIGFTSEHVYAETPDWVISRLSRVEIHRAESKITDVPDANDHGLASADLASGSGEAPAQGEGLAEADVPSGQAEPPCRIGKGDAPIVPASALGSHGGSPSRDGIDMAAPSVIATVDDSSPSLITSDEASGTPAEQVSPAQVLACLAAGARLFRSNDGRLFAQVPVGDRLEV
jgi:hypothetical protein